VRQKKSLCVFILQLRFLFNHLFGKNLLSVYYMPRTYCFRHCGYSTNRREKSPCSDGAYILGGDYNITNNIMLP